MKHFHYGLSPALDAARREEEIAARAFVVSRDAACVAETHVAELIAAADAIRARGRANEMPVTVHTLLDREGALGALAARHARACDAAAEARWYRDAARGTYDAGRRRLRSFEAHRDGARARYERERERYEAAEFDEANASRHEAGRVLTGKDDA